jgi:hypothetical protein
MPSETPEFIRRLICALSAAAAAGAVCFGMAFAQTRAAAAPFGSPATFRVSKAMLRSQGAPAALIDKLGASPYAYFRLLAQPFAERACYEFRDLRWRLPSVAVHGDAHVEQFVVTDDAYGLTDFDRSGFGPAVIDLVRYAASIHLTCRAVAWRCDPGQTVAAYFEAYRSALDHPVDRREPSIVERVRVGIRQDRQTWLQWADDLMEPIEAADERAIRDGWFRFVALMKDTVPERPAAFYRIARIGALHLGIGSALEPKTLIRITGPTDAPDDDLILEARVAPTPNGRECVSRPLNGGPLHVFMLTSLLAHRLPEVFGFLPREGAPWAPELWIQSWDHGYRELAVKDIHGQAELIELASDAGTQLAGHFWTTFPEPLRGHQRFAQLRAFEMTAGRARDLARAFADETAAEWERFRRQR